MKSFTLLNHVEIDIIDEAIEELADNEIIKSALMRHRKDVVREHNALVKELNRIKEDDPEIYQIIYWYDIRGRSWMETFNKVYQDMPSSNPVAYARKKLFRYMDKHTSHQEDGYCRPLAEV